jgi:hypothetical protein
MPNKDKFINEAISEMFRTYNRSKEQPLSVEYNSFYSSVIRMLILIYGEDIVKYYETNDIQGFVNTILKFGYDNNLYEDFVLMCNKFYKSEVKKEDKAIKKKNKYFNLVQKHLIDMMIQRNDQKLVDSVTMKEFYDLLFTAKSNNFYRMSYALLVAYNPYEIDEYAKKHKIVG